MLQDMPKAQIAVQKGQYYEYASGTGNSSISDLKNIVDNLTDEEYYDSFIMIYPSYTTNKFICYPYMLPVKTYMNTSLQNSADITDCLYFYNGTIYRVIKTFDNTNKTVVRSVYSTSDTGTYALTVNSWYFYKRK